MNRDESHRQGRGLSFPPGTSSCGILELELQALQERVMIDRSFVNCPRLRHSSKFALLHFQRLTNGKVIALSPVRGYKGDHMLRIQREANGHVVLRISGRLGGENLTELKKLIESDETDRRIVLDLRELTLVDQEAVRFLEQCDSNGIELQNCPPYIGESLARQTDGKRL